MVLGQTAERKLPSFGIYGFVKRYFLYAEKLTPTVNKTSK